MLTFKSLTWLALASSPVSAFWRLPCQAPIVVERLDPIVNPGAISGHAHTIMGGNGFAATMDYNSTQASTCSSCTVIGDNSNYWIPTLWYQNQDGTFESVKQVGGATVYYLQRSGNDASGKPEQLKAFPPGFRMLAGNPNKRSGGNDFPTQAISYNCLGTSDPETPTFPTHNCPNGLRAQVFFPSCWNGKDLDSADHKSHVSYPANSYNSGSCPPDYPVHLISIFYEVIWSTPDFANRWYGNKQPFVWSNGDPTGYGLHGDFIMGWEEEHLQQAVDDCTNLSGRVEDCQHFQLISNNQATGCSVPSSVNEVVTGHLDKLPGCNAVYAGPGDAPKQSDCGATGVLDPGASGPGFTDLTSEGWSYLGCGQDNYYNRILTGASTSSDSMTNDQCVQFCQSKGFSVAGTEYARECYCGNSVPDQGAPIPGVPGNCKMPCSGDSTQMCGGSGPIGLYTKCSGSTCVNAIKTPAGGNTPSTPSTGGNTGSSPSSGPSKPSSSSTAASQPSQTQGSGNAAPSGGSSSGGGNQNSSPGTGNGSSSPSSGSPPNSQPSSGGNSPGSGSPSGGNNPSNSSPPPPVDTTPYESGNPSGDDELSPSSGSPPSSQPSHGNGNGSGNNSPSPPASSPSSTTSAIPTIHPTPSPNTQSPLPSNATIPSGWAYVGCYTDTVFPRSLPVWSNFNGPKMSNSACMAYCDSKSMPYAGTEYAGQCFCGEGLVGSQQGDEGQCNSPCTGAAGESCGGKSVLSLWYKGSESKKARVRRHLAGHAGGKMH